MRTGIGGRSGGIRSPRTFSGPRPSADAPPDLRRWARRRPRVGGPHDPARPADRSGPDPPRAGRQAALKRNVPDEVATRLLDRFTEVGLIDDAAFARLWVESRQAGRGLAKRALADELRRKGVDAEVVREAVDEIDPATEEAAGPQRWCARSCRRCATSTAPPPPGGWSACWPARAIPPALAFAVVKDELGPRRGATTARVSSARMLDSHIECGGPGIAAID